MTNGADETWPPKELREWANQKVQVVRDAATEGGLRFRTYLPPELALWLLDRIEQGMFIDPSEAVFVLLDDPKMTLQAICDRLETMRERTPRGRTRWQPSSVKMLLERAERLGLL